MQFMIQLPDWAHFLSIEFDKSIWIARYDPLMNLKQNSSNNKILAMADGTVTPGTTRLEPNQLGKELRYLTTTLKIVTQAGRPYQEHCFEQALLDFGDE